MPVTCYRPVSSILTVIARQLPLPGSDIQPSIILTIGDVRIALFCDSDHAKIKSRLTAALVINSFESRPVDLVTTVTDHPERTGWYLPYVSLFLLRDIRSNHTVLGCLPLLFPQCCR